MESHYCKALFALAFAGAYFLIPQKVFFGWYILLALAFMLSFAATFTCLLRDLKEHIFAAKVATNSMLGAIATTIGFSALQACGIGIPFCGASFGFMLLSAVLPGMFINFLMDYSVAIVVFSIALQLFSLHQMKCFEAESCCKPEFFIPGK